MHSRFENRISRGDLLDRKTMVVNDSILFDKIKVGNIQAFEQLFKKYYAVLVHYAQKYLPKTEDAEEIVQDLFTAFWEKRGSIIIRSSVKAYLFRSVHNNCLLFLQHQAVEQKYEKYIKSGEIHSEPDPSESLKAKELADTIRKTIHSMPERTQTIFKMSRYDNLTYNEIAEKLSISIKTVEANMGKALKTLRQYLKEYISILTIILLQL